MILKRKSQKQRLDQGSHETLVLHHEQLISNLKNEHVGAAKHSGDIQNFWKENSWQWLHSKFETQYCDHSSQSEHMNVAIMSTEKRFCQRTVQKASFFVHRLIGLSGVSTVWSELSTVILWSVIDKKFSVHLKVDLKVLLYSSVLIVVRKSSLNP